MRITSPLLSVFLSTIFLFHAVVFSQTCNVLSPELSGTLDTVIQGTFEADDLVVISPATFNSGEGSVTVANASFAGVASTFWFSERRRVADGFSARFQVEIPEGETDGFAFVVQPLRTNNIQGAGGQNLGFRNGVETYLAVGFDLCPSRGDDNNCIEEVVRIEVRSEELDEDFIIAEFFNQGNGNNNPAMLINSGNPTSFKVDYLQDENEVIVSINNFEVGRANFTNVAESLEDLFGRKTAFIGFTGANNDLNQPATIKVMNLDVVQMHSNSRLNTENFITEVESLGNVVYELAIVDSCNNPLSLEDVQELNISAAEITAVLSAQNEANEQNLGPSSITLQNNGIFLITFLTPVGQIDTWDLNIVVDGFDAQNMPRVGVLNTIEAPASGLSPLGIGLLAALICVLLIGVVYMIRRLDRYRQQLNKHAEDIEYGRVKKEIDEIDKEITYSMNPMIAPLEELQARLKANQVTITNLKNQREGLGDPEAEIQQLIEQNAALKKQMKQLRQDQEKNAAGSRFSAIFGGRRRKGNDREDFGQERA